MMNESSGPRKARRCGECHVLFSTVKSREGIAEPQRKLLFPDASFELRIQESGTGPRVAQCTSDTVLPRSRSWRLDGRFRLQGLLAVRWGLNKRDRVLMEAGEALGDEAVVWSEGEKRGGARCVTHWSDLRAIGV